MSTKRRNKYGPGWGRTPWLSRKVTRVAQLDSLLKRFYAPAISRMLNEPIVGFKLAPELGNAKLNITTEIRKTDPTTGAQKGSKLARFDLMPAEPLRQLAEHFGKGSQKYADRNWEKGYDWGLSFAALMRHAWAFWGGEDIDAETGTPHVIAVAWHALALAEFMRTHPEKDTRSKK